MKITDETTLGELRLAFSMRGVRDARVFMLSNGSITVCVFGGSGAMGSGHQMALADAIGEALDNIARDDLGAVSPER